MSSKNNKDQHAFAFFYPETSSLGTDTPLGSICKISDHALCHRIMHVLRLNKGESFTLFDSHKHLECVLESLNERNLQATVRSFGCNAVFAPHITFMLPLLKKEGMEHRLSADSLR